MAENTKIEWCDHSWNPWIGCTKVSSACDNCYAEVATPTRVKRKAGQETWGPHADRQRTKTWGNPIKWNKALEGTGKREKVFVASLADVFDNHKSILPEWRTEMWEIIKSCTNLDFLLLTKRSQNIEKYLPDDWGKGYLNVWLGTTAEDQAEAERRIPHLLDVPAKIHFLSCEPLLEGFGLSRWLYERLDVAAAGLDDDPLAASMLSEAIVQGTGSGPMLPRIDWVIVGGESGPGARPIHPDWVRGLRDQCLTAGVPFFFKQWGEWLPGHYSISKHSMLLDPSNGPKSGMTLREPPHAPSYVHDWGDGFIAAKVGKKKAGGLLDGKIIQKFPGEVA